MEGIGTRLLPDKFYRQIHLSDARKKVLIVFGGKDTRIAAFARIYEQEPFSRETVNGTVINGTDSRTIERR